MAKDINGTPSTGTPNTGTVIHQEFNFHGDVHNVNPAANSVHTTIINNNGVREDGELKEVPSKQDEAIFDKAVVREEIIEYAYRLKNKYKPEWRPYVKQLWNDIVALSAVDAEIYDRGRQKGTNFDRNLVGNIICFLNAKGLFEGEYNMTEYKRILMDGGKNGQSVREALAFPPSAEIKDSIDHLLANKKYF